MRTWKAVIFAIGGLALSYPLSGARPTPAPPVLNAEPGTKECPRDQTSDEILLVIKKNSLRAIARRVMERNLPYNVYAKSVGVDGQIWSKGDNYFEFHDNPSVDFNATLKTLTLQVPPGDQLTFQVALTADFSGKARFKRMLAHKADHGNVALKKDNVTIAARLTFLPVDNAWIRAILTVVSPDSVPVTAETKLFGIDIGVPFSIPVPAGQTVADISIQSAFGDFKPIRATVGSNLSYCVYGGVRQSS